MTEEPKPDATARALKKRKPRKPRTSLATDIIYLWQLAKVWGIRRETLHRTYKKKQLVPLPGFAPKAFAIPAVEKLYPDIDIRATLARIEKEEAGQPKIDNARATGGDAPVDHPKLNDNDPVPFQKMAQHDENVIPEDVLLRRLADRLAKERDQLLSDEHDQQLMDDYLDYYEEMPSDAEREKQADELAEWRAMLLDKREPPK